MLEWKAVLESIIWSHVTAALCVAGILIALEAVYVWVGIRVEQDRLQDRKSVQPPANSVADAGSGPGSGWRPLVSEGERQEREHGVGQTR